MSKSIDLLRAADNDRNLFILYYAGHGRINSARQAEWTCTRDPNYASVDWSAIQSLFAKARSDVLILLDTCAAASSTMRSQYGTMEAIVACGFESRAAPPGEYSFTNTLIEVLDDWINRRTFSASCLHAEILFQLKLKETRKGREGVKLEWCTTPVHINYTQDSKLPGIELCRRNILPAPIQAPPEPENSTTFVDAMDIDFDESTSSPSPLSSVKESGELQTPHVLIKIGLEQNQAQLDAKQCLRWLESVPFLGKWAKIEGVYPSFSTLIILSMPMCIWDMLPDHPACSFIGYITAPNLIPPALGEGRGNSSSTELPVNEPPKLDIEHMKAPMSSISNSEFWAVKTRLDRDWSIDSGYAESTASLARAASRRDPLPRLAEVDSNATPKESAGVSSNPPPGSVDSTSRLASRFEPAPKLSARAGSTSAFRRSSRFVQPPTISAGASSDPTPKPVYRTPRLVSKREPPPESAPKVLPRSSNAGKPRPPGSWHCCQCGDGPNSLTYVTACFSCYHTRCTECSVLTL